MARNYETVLSDAMEDHLKARVNLDNSAFFDGIMNRNTFLFAYSTSFKGSVLVACKALLDKAKKEKDPEKRKNFGKMSVSLFKAKDDLLTEWREGQMHIKYAK